MNLASHASALLTLLASVSSFGVLSLAQAEDDEKEQHAHSKTLVVRVELVPSQRSFENADVIISIEDLTREGGKVERLAQRKFTKISYDGKPGTVLEFKVDKLEPKPNHHYNLRVLVDLDCDGRISRGDYRSIERKYVFTGNDPPKVTIRAEMKGE